MAKGATTRGGMMIVMAEGATIRGGTMIAMAEGATSREGMMIVVVSTDLVCIVSLCHAPLG